MKNIVNKKAEVIPRKLKEIEKLVGMSPQEMAKIGGCSISTYYRYRSGTSVPDYIFLSNILNNEKKISADWLLRGKGAILNSLSNGNLSEGMQATEVPFYKMKQLHNKGEGALSLKEWNSSSEMMPICNEFLEFIENDNYDSVFSLLIQCDAMYPAIKPGSIVLVNKSLTNITEDGVFILKFDNVIRMKLVQKLPKGKVELGTINKKYNSIRLTDEEFSEIEILGKIFWAGVPM